MFFGCLILAEKKGLAVNWARVAEVVCSRKGAPPFRPLTGSMRWDKNVGDDEVGHAEDWQLNIGERVVDNSPENRSVNRTEEGVPPHADGNGGADANVGNGGDGDMHGCDARVVGCVLEKRAACPQHGKPWHHSNEFVCT